MQPTWPKCLRMLAAGLNINDVSITVIVTGDIASSTAMIVRIYFRYSLLFSRLNVGALVVLTLRGRLSLITKLY